MSDVIKRVTQEQKDIVGSIEIPSFMAKDDDYYFDDEESQAILNNIPGNTEIEEINHLNELEVVCQNWKEAEWIRILKHADSTLICKELNERLVIQEDFIRNQKANLNTLSKLR